MRFPTIFGATWLQVLTYLGGVAVGSICLLVFLNASISFVITDVIEQKDAIGDATGTLGFADELVAILFSPLAGLLSDRLGVRMMCTFAFLVTGSALFTITHSRKVYPDLLLNRLFFSLGGASASCMLTALVPSMSIGAGAQEDTGPGPALSPDAAAETVSNHSTEVRSSSDVPMKEQVSAPRSSSSVAGFVGFASGIGALLALLVLLRIPAFFKARDFTKAESLRYCYYITGFVSYSISLVCFVGLRNLSGEEGKGFRNMFRGLHRARGDPARDDYNLPKAIRLVVADRSLRLANIGGFVARASSVAITTFVPLYVNTCFINSGQCDTNGEDLRHIKHNCRDAYIVSSQLTGVSQSAALVGAVFFGILGARYSHSALPLLISAIFGLAGYCLFAVTTCPSTGASSASPWLFAVMILIGLSQIGAIVCSLAMLGQGVLGDALQTPNQTVMTAERQALMPRHGLDDPPADYKSFKGSIAGIYNLTGGVAILLLTKIGGIFFDKTSPTAPFWMLAVFNGFLLVACILMSFSLTWVHRRDA